MLVCIHTRDIYKHIYCIFVYVCTYFFVCMCYCVYMLMSIAMTKSFHWSPCEKICVAPFLYNLGYFLNQKGRNAFWCYMVLVEKAISMLCIWEFYWLPHFCFFEEILVLSAEKSAQEWVKPSDIIVAYMAIFMPLVLFSSIFSCVYDVKVVLLNKADLMSTMRND